MKILILFVSFFFRRDKLTGDFNPIDVKLRYLAPSAYILSILFFGILIYNNIFF